jgi:hypothetical protein
MDGCALVAFVATALTVKAKNGLHRASHNRGAQIAETCMAVWQYLSTICQHVHVSMMAFCCGLHFIVLSLAPCCCAYILDEADT